MMGLPPPGWRLWVLLGAAAALLLRGCCGSGSTNHSLNVFSVGMSEPSQGVSWFTTVFCVDDQLVAGYDSDGRRLVPRVSWAEKLQKQDPELWHMETRILQARELRVIWLLGTVRKIYHHSGGLHALQLRTGCELNAGGQKGGHHQLVYDGRGIFSFDKENLTWTAADGPVQVLTKMWEAEQGLAQSLKEFLEETCIEWLQKYLLYGKEALQRREPPLVKVTRRASPEGLETLTCRAHGFYPKGINITWRKDGEVREADTVHGVVSPNSDGTYYTWVSVDIDPQERSRFRCHVEHDGLLEPLDVAVEEPVSLLVGVTLMVVIVLLLLTGIVLYTRVAKGPASLLSNRPPPTLPTSLDADLSCPPVSFQREGAGAEVEQAEQGSGP